MDKNFLRFTKKHPDGRDILTEGISSTFRFGEYMTFYEGDAVDRFAEYETLEETGRLVKLPNAAWIRHVINALPRKVWVSDNGRVVEADVVGYRLPENGINMLDGLEFDIEYGDGKTSSFSAGDIGNRVFYEEPISSETSMGVEDAHPCRVSEGIKKDAAILMRTPELPEKPFAAAYGHGTKGYYIQRTENPDIISVTYMFSDGVYWICEGYHKYVYRGDDTSALRGRISVLKPGPLERESQEYRDECRLKSEFFSGVEAGF